MINVRLAAWHGGTLPGVAALVSVRFISDLNKKVIRLDSFFWAWRHSQSLTSIYYATIWSASKYLTFLPPTVIS